METTRRRLGIIGVGNVIAGDDGVGVEVVRRLREGMGEREGVFFHTLEGDLLEMSDLLHKAERFIIVDAIAGGREGEIRIATTAPRGFAPSFHQTDIGTVMNTLAQLGCADPFPHWEVWGICIRPPDRVGQGLSPAVERSAGKLVDKLAEEIARL